MIKTSFEGISIRLLYLRYQKYLKFIGIALLSIVLLIFFVIPQIQEFFSLKAEERRFAEQNKILQNNINFLQSLDENGLEADFQVASLSVPAQKDFENILSSVSTAADKAGVTLGDFTFRVGDLSTKSAALSSSQNLQIDVQIVGTIDSITQFVNNIYAQLPLVQITSIEMNGRSAAIHTIFPFKPYSATKYQINKPIGALSTAEQELFLQLQKWYENSGAKTITPAVESSSSGAPNFTITKPKPATSSAQ